MEFNIKAKAYIFGIPLVDTAFLLVFVFITAYIFQIKGNYFLLYFFGTILLSSFVDYFRRRNIKFLSVVGVDALLREIKIRGDVDIINQFIESAVKNNKKLIITYPISIHGHYFCIAIRVLCNDLLLDYELYESKKPNFSIKLEASSNIKIISYADKNKFDSTIEKLYHRGWIPDGQPVVSKSILSTEYTQKMIRNIN